MPQQFPQQNVPISQDENCLSAGWLNGEALYEEMEATLPIEGMSGYDIIKEGFEDAGIPTSTMTSYYGLISQPTPSHLRVKLSLGTTALEAAQASEYYQLSMSRVISTGNLGFINLNGPFPNPPPAQASLPQSVPAAQSSVIPQDQQPQTTPFDMSLVADTDSSTSNKFSNLGFDKSFGVSATANSIVTEKKLQEQINSQQDSVIADGNSLNSKGIYTNRPTIIINSNFVPLESTAAISRFESSIMYQLLKNNKLYNYFQDLKKSDIETYTELTQDYEEFRRTIRNSLHMIETIDQFKKDFVNSLNNYSDFGLQNLGYTDKIKPTKAINQLIYDIGAMPFYGDEYFSKHMKKGEIRDISDEKYNATERAIYTDVYTGMNNVVFEEEPNQNWVYPKINPSFGLFEEAIVSISNIFNKVDPYQPHEMFEMEAGFVSNANKFHSNTLMCQFVWCELYKSYIYASGDTAFKNTMDVRKEKKNIFYDLIGESFDLGLLEADNSSGIAHILRYPEDGKTIMSLEKPGLEFEDEGFSKIKSGVESWIDPNIGNLFEGRTFDFNGLDFFVEEFSKFIKDSKSIIDPYAISGHGQLILNEFIRSLEKVGDTGERYHMKEALSPSDNQIGFDSFNAFYDDEAIEESVADLIE